MNTALSIDAAENSSAQLSWKDVLNGEREKSYFRDLLTFLENERGKGKIIYPKNSEIFNALHLTPFEKVKVVIIGQDPYHGPNQAHGLCFSVKPGVPQPPSLQNIFKEIKNDLGINPPRSGCLQSWAAQGVLLLNAVLSVEAGKPQSHANLGWETFTDRVVTELNQHRKGLVFMLWGAYAQKKGAVIDRSIQHVLETVHPSPLSASRGFFGCAHFSQANALLEAQGIEPINWTIS